MKIFDRRSIRLKGYDYSQPGAYFVTICTENRQCLFGNIVKGEMVLNSCGRVVEEYCLISENHFQNIKFDIFVIMPNHFHVIIKIIDTTITHYNPVGAGSPRPNVNNGHPNINNSHPNLNNTDHNVNNRYLNVNIKKSNKNNTYPNENIEKQNVDNLPNDVVNGIGSIFNTIGRGDPAPTTTLGQIVGFFKYGVSKHINQIRKIPGIKLWQRNYYEHIIRNENEYGRISEYITTNPMKWEMDSFNPNV